MRVLFLSYYFVPDICAGAFRSNAIVTAMNENEYIAKVDLLTTQPNRYSSMKEKVNTIEQLEKVRIVRFYVPFRGGGFFKQSISFTFYFIQVLLWITNKKYDLVFATSSRIMTGYLGAICSSILKAPLYLDVRDLFRDTLKDLYGKKKLVSAFLHLIVRKIELYTFSSTRRLNLVSEGFADYIKLIYPNCRLTFFTNGIDEEFLNTDYNTEEKDNQRTRIAYVGNIGDGQGLEKIIPPLAIKLGGGVDFIIVGDGGAKGKLRASLANIQNVKLLETLSRDEIVNIYKISDILFLHLNNIPAFKKVLPSKLFEYASTGKPILAGVSGYAKAFCENELEGVSVFDPCNVGMAVTSFESLAKEKCTFDRSNFIKKFSRSSISKNIVTEMVHVGREGRCL